MRWIHGWNRATDSNLAFSFLAGSQLYFLSKLMLDESSHDGVFHHEMPELAHVYQRSYIDIRYFVKHFDRQIHQTRNRNYRIKKLRKREGCMIQPRRPDFGLSEDLIAIGERIHLRDCTALIHSHHLPTSRRLSRSSSLILN